MEESTSETGVKGLNQFYSRETAPVILMQLTIRNKSLVRERSQGL